MWGIVFPVIVFSEDRSVPRFIQSEIVPPPLGNACDYDQYNFVIAHVAGAAAADFFSIAGVNPTLKLEMNIRNDVATQALEVNIQSTGAAEEESLYILPSETPQNEKCGKRKKYCVKRRKGKLTMTQKKKCQNFKSFITSQREQLFIEKDTSKTHLRARIGREYYDETEFQTRLLVKTLTTKYNPY